MFFDKDNDNILYKICKNPKLGRYLVANDEIVSSEVIIDELPYVIGPMVNSRVICLECYYPVESIEIGSRCDLCKWPLCTSCNENQFSKFKYLQLKHHIMEECNILKCVKFQNMDDDSNGCPQLDCITPLRILLKKEREPERWEKELADMEYHDESRRKNIEIWNADLNNVAKYLRGPCKLMQFSEELIMQVIGILEVNAFEARTTLNFPLRALYPTTGILAHDCVPNTMRTVYPSEDFRIRLRAMVDIKSGEQLKHSYTHTLTGTAKRLHHLQIGKFFLCKCMRCSDATELGTHFSSFKCEKCNSHVVTSNPYDENARWNCNNCNHTMFGSEINDILLKLENEMKIIQDKDFDETRIFETEKLCKTYLNILSKSHYILISLKQDLIELYGRAKNYETSKLPNDLLKRKEVLCKELLEILNKFEPGLGRQRAYLNFQLYQAIFLYSKSEYESRKIGKKEYKQKLLDAHKYLYECQGILQFEDQTSQEGNLYRIALIKLNEITKEIDLLADEILYYPERNLCVETEK